MLKYYTAGESHGRALVTIIEGMPAGLPISVEEVNRQLKRRQGGYGRGGRMKIEQDQADILAGVRAGRTTGSPIAFSIANRDWENWQEVMAVENESASNERAVTRPRPGHADLPGAMKYHHADMRNILERASARETASRVAAGSFCSQLLEAFGIHLYGQVIAIGGIKGQPAEINAVNRREIMDKLESSAVRTIDGESEARMVAAIDQARQGGESLGGCFEVGALGVPPGLGTFATAEGRLDARLGALLLSIPAIKAVEIGEGINNSVTPGSKVHDEIHYRKKQGIYRLTNLAGGIEGGMSNGETVWVRAYMKPIPTLYKPLVSVNTVNWEEQKADIERSDICAVPAASVVGEAMLAYGLAAAFLEKFGGDFIDQIREAYDLYCEYLRKEWKWRKI